MTDNNETRDPFAGLFMQPQVYFGGYFEVETDQGTEIVPDDVCGRTMTTVNEALQLYLDGTPLDMEGEAEHKEGWLARMSAPGYMDCTSWSAHATEQEAMTYLIEMYGDE